MTNLRTLLAIAPNFKKRLSGVTSTVINLVPPMQKMKYDIRTLGPGLPPNLPSISFIDLFKLYQKPLGATHRIFHARRNNEMLFAVFLRDIMRLPLKLIFTSASQRKHTKYTQWLMSRMDHIIATSSKTTPFIEPFLKKNGKIITPITVVMHGVDTDRFTPTHHKSKHKHSLGLDANALYIGCFGRVRPKKGTDLFVDSMIKTLKHNKNWKAIILGRTTPQHKKFEGSLKQRIKDAGMEEQILFLGEKKNIQEYYKALDIYVVPSLYEGYGLTPLEAMACGTPTIATDVGVFREIIPKKCGYIVKTTADDMSKHVNLYLASPTLLETHGTHALKHVRKIFTLDHEAKGILDVYKKLQS